MAHAPAPRQEAPRKSLSDSVSEPSFFQRFSRHGELPWSSAISLALHLIAIVIIMLLTVKLTKPDPTPPTVDTIRVDSSSTESAAGLGDDGIAAPGLEASEPEQQDADPTPVSQDREEIAAVEPTTPTTTTQPGNTINDTATEAVRASRAAAAQAKQHLANKVGKNMGQGKGGGGGTGDVGRAARPARWQLQFRTRDGADHLRQFDALGATLAIPAEGDKYWYFKNLTSGKPTKTKQDLGNEGRLFWTDENPETVRRVCQALGVNAASILVAFLPLALEDRMLKMELAYGNLGEDEIMSTRFEVFSTGNGYDVKVVGQTPR